jgi:mevalonate kinase
MFGVNPFDLHFQTSAGSGYDVACASASGSILYTLKANNIPEVRNVDFNPDFSDKLYFVYLGQKQQSHQSIRDFHSRLLSRKLEVHRVSEISHELLATHDLEEFEFFLNELEQIMSGVLALPTVKEKLFADFPGTVKSLGAWGGDFVLMTWREDFGKLKRYLQAKNLDVVFKYEEMVLSH